ncbi:MAG TPA: histidine phosphatase family protein [Parachlamydiaceae bacterium]|nr:histidine phosphatase family protein [Parachlamydiaceae bacterium]
MKLVATLFILFTSLFSGVYGEGFKKNTALVDALKAKNIRLVVLCNFRGTNNIEDIITSSNSPAYEITSSGLQLLDDTAPILAKYDISHIYVSMEFRVQQTANLLGKALGLAPDQLSLDPRLRMQHFGNAEGEDYDLYKARFDSKKEMLESAPKNGEAGIKVFKRTQDFLLTLKNLNEGETVLIVTHAFNFCHIAKCLTGKYNQVVSPGTFVVYDFQ